MRRNVITVNPWLMAVIFLGIGVIVSYIVGQVQIVSCQRIEIHQVNCSARYTWLGVVPVGQASFDGVSHAQTGISRGSKSSNYRIELVTASGTMPLTQFYTSNNPNSSVVAINRFLSSNDPSLNLTINGLSLFVCFPLSFIVGAGLIVFQEVRGRLRAGQAEVL